MQSLESLRTHEVHCTGCKLSDLAKASNLRVAMFCIADWKNEDGDIDQFQEEGIQIIQACYKSTGKKDPRWLIEDEDMDGSYLDGSKAIVLLRPEHNTSVLAYALISEAGDGWEDYKVSDIVVAGSEGGTGKFFGIEKFEEVLLGAIEWAVISYHAQFSWNVIVEEGAISISQEDCCINQDLLAARGYVETEFDDEDVYRKEDCSFRVLKQAVIGEGPVFMHPEVGPCYFPEKTKVAMQSLDPPMHLRDNRYKPY